MKTFWKTENRAIDNLLRSHLSQQDAAGALCKEFDPDLATAYIERCLTPAKQASYERHISLCTSCRKSTVALARMARSEADPATVSLAAASGESRAGWLAPLRGFIAGLSRPQVALAAVAIITLAVSLPIMLSREKTIPAQRVSEIMQAESLPVAPAASQDPVPAASALLDVQKAKASAAKTDAAVGAVAAARDENENRQQTDDAAGNDKAGQQAAAQAGQAALADAKKTDVQKNEVKTDPAASTEHERRLAQEAPKEGDAPKPSPPAAQPEEQKPLPRINAEEALSLRKDKDSVNVTPLKPGRPDVDAKTKEPTGTIRPENAVAPPSESSSGDSARRGRIASDQGGRAFRENKSRSAAPKRGTPERKINGKKFYLLNDVWTDKDYKPEKEMAVVTIARNSDLYKEVLAKRSALKTFFTLFDEQERAIIVYKDTVYRLVPPEK